MSSGKKHSKKRKHHSSPLKSRIAVRLERLRSRRIDLWADDDNEPSPPSNVITLSDSEEEKPARKRKSRRKTPKNATCLICSILSQLSTKNCCADHLSRLKHPQWLPEQVMILPVTDQMVQRYLDPQQIHQLRTQTSTNSTGKLSKKSTMTIDLAGSQSSTQHVSTSPPESPLPPLASTIVFESARSNSATIPPAAAEPPVIDTTESVTIIEEDAIIIIDDAQFEATTNKPPHDPWIPITDETATALEQALDQVESSFDTPLEYTPTTVRRTATEIMAARLPKIPLKPGRFRHGKSILDRSTTSAANEYRPLAPAVQSPPNIRPPSPTSNAENRTDNVFTQDEHNELPTTTRTTNEKTTPSRVSFRLNPDGTRVSISRPPLPTNAQSPLLSSLRRTSTDVTPFSKQV